MKTVEEVVRDSHIYQLHHAIQKQGNKTWTAPAPARPSPIDWKPFIAAFHRLAPKMWKARTLILDGNLLLRLVGDEQTLEAKLRAAFCRLTVQFGELEQTVKNAVDDMLLDFRLAEQLRIEAMKEANEAEARKHLKSLGAPVTLDTAPAVAEVREAPPLHIPMKWVERVNPYTVQREKEPAPEFQPRFKVGDEVETTSDTKPVMGIIRDIGLDSNGKRDPSRMTITISENHTLNTDRQWVRHRAKQTVQSAQLRAIAPLEYQPPGTPHIIDAATALVRLAESSGAQCFMVFNDVRLEAMPFTSVGEVLISYEAATAARAKPAEPEPQLMMAGERVEWDTTDGKETFRGHLRQNVTISRGKMTGTVRVELDDGMMVGVDVRLVRREKLQVTVPRNSLSVGDILNFRIDRVGQIVCTGK